MSIGLPHATTSHLTRTNQAPSQARATHVATSMLMTSGRSARQHLRRATRVPQAEVNHGQPGSLLTTSGRRSRPVPGHHCRVPKLMTKRKRLRRASAPGWPQAGHEGGGIPAPPAVLRQSHHPRAIRVLFTTVTNGHQQDTLIPVRRRSRPLITRRAQPSKLAMPVRSRSPVLPCTVAGEPACRAI